MTAAELIAHCTTELDAISKRSTSPTIDAQCAALKTLLATEVPTLAPTYTERRSGIERRNVERADLPGDGDRRAARRAP